MNEVSIIENQKKELAYFMRRLYKRKLTTSLGGNISVRTSHNMVLISPSQTDKARIKATNIGTVDLKGLNQSPEIVLSMETKMHLAIFNTRPEVMAIIHAHPAIATAFAAAGENINAAITAESYAVLGNPVLTSYALLGTQKLAIVVAEAMKKNNVALMANHGVIAVGKTLLEAFERIEVLENCAKMNIALKLIDKSNNLTLEQLREIDEIIGL